MREFTTRFSTACACVRMRFKEMAPFFFLILEPSAPTTLTSWAESNGVRVQLVAAQYDRARAVSITEWGRTPSSTRIVYSGNVKPKPGGGTPVMRAGRCVVIRTPVVTRRAS
jgi:hypothetical protein